MRCVVLSLHRSATRSTADLLGQAGLRTIHHVLGTGIRDEYEARVRGRETDLDHVFAVTEPFLAGFDAAADVPMPVLYRQFDRRFPEARFILVRRGVEGWIGSVRRHTAGRNLLVGERIQYWAYLPRPISLAEVTDRDLRTMHDAHTAAVAEHFAERPGKLLIVGLDDPAIGARIGAFLGVARPLSFPALADTAAPAPKTRSAWRRLARALGGRPG